MSLPFKNQVKFWAAQSMHYIIQNRSNKTDSLYLPRKILNTVPQREKRREDSRFNLCANIHIKSYLYHLANLK